MRQFCHLLLLLGLLAVATACSTAPATDATVDLDATVESSGVIETRAPVPTATPGAVARVVDQTVDAAGLAEVSFLGLSSSDWINLAISLLLVLAGYIAGSWVARLLHRWALPLLSADDAENYVAKIAYQVRWLVTLVAAHFAIVRLSVLSAEIKDALLNLIVVAGVILAARALWYAIDLAVEELRKRIDPQREAELDPALMLGVRILRVVLVLIVVSLILTQFGINITAFVTLLGIGGLAFSLAARTTIEDAIAGAIILADRPFRVGDRIEVAAAGTWGDVTDIGLRTTRVRTRDNRLVIIPNGLIAKNEIINYTYPDPTYRIETHVSIAYGTPVEQAREVLETAVRSVPDVLPNRPVDILYSEMGDSAMIIRVRWWIETYADTRRVTDKIHTAIQNALDEASIESPFPTQTILLEDGDKYPPQ